MTNNDGYNFSALDPRTQRTLVALLAGFYAGAAHFAKGNKMSLEVAEMTFSRGCLDVSHSLEPEVIQELIASIDKHETGLFSSEMSERMWTWAKAQEAAAISLDEDEDEDDEGEDFSFIDEDDALDFLAEFGWVRPDTEDITDE